MLGVMERIVRDNTIGKGSFSVYVELKAITEYSDRQIIIIRCAIRVNIKGISFMYFILLA